MVLVPGKESHIYAAIKTLGDTIFGIPTQVILKKNTFIDNKSAQKIHNICLKLNAKLGGINQVINPKSTPASFGRPVSSDFNCINSRELFICLYHNNESYLLSSYRTQKMF